MHDRSHIRILLLDDEPFMLKLLTRMLTVAGYAQVSSHERGADALAAIEGTDEKPDVIMLDINMPGLDGVEFVRCLAEQKYAGALVLVSGEDELVLQATEKLARARQLSVLGSLRKPATSAGIAAILDKWSPSVAAKSRATSKIYDADAVKAAIDQGELVNYYQPKVLVSTGDLIGVETLVRWQHPQDGLVFPDQFISVAENHGLIGGLTRAVLKGALLQSRAWLEVGMTLRVAVNVSMDDLADLAFVDFVAAEIAASGVPAQSVVLELTESRLTKNLATVLDVLTRLRLKRIRLSIDDFGTGHSSLVQLRDLPFDELKIDQSFTHRAGTDARLRAIFEASLDLARHLNMEVVAEGVEDAEDWAFLRGTGCTVAQGYFIARPMPAEQLPEWMKEWQVRLRADGK